MTDNSEKSSSIGHETGGTQHTGTVKWFNDTKGFGFIQHESGKDVFVHYSVIETEGFKTLKDGEEVVYEMKDGPKGLQAVRVSRPAGSSSPAKGSAESSSLSDALHSSEIATSATGSANLPSSGIGTPDSAPGSNAVTSTGATSGAAPQEARAR